VPFFFFKKKPGVLKVLKHGTTPFMESLTIGDIVERYWQASKNYALCSRQIEQGRAFLYCHGLQTMSRTQLLSEVLRNAYEFQQEELNQLHTCTCQEIVDIFKYHKERQVGMRMSLSNDDKMTIEQITRLMVELEQRRNRIQLWINCYLDIINRDRARLQLPLLSREVNLPQTFKVGDLIMAPELLLCIGEGALAPPQTPCN
jgi:hypothetical protein